MDEQRKDALLLAATILAARKLDEVGSKPEVLLAKQTDPNRQGLHPAVRQ
jgi:hypothetical protein